MVYGLSIDRIRSSLLLEKRTRGDGNDNAIGLVAGTD